MRDDGGGGAGAGAGAPRRSYSAYQISEGAQMPLWWTAPECWGRGAYVVRRSDIWMLGMFFWEVLSYGEVPYASVRRKHDELRQKCREMQGRGEDVGDVERLMGLECDGWISVLTKAMGTGERPSVPDDAKRYIPAIEALLQDMWPLSDEKRPHATEVTERLNAIRATVSPDHWTEGGGGATFAKAVAAAFPEAEGQKEEIADGVTSG